MEAWDLVLDGTLAQLDRIPCGHAVIRDADHFVTQQRVSASPQDSKRQTLL
jgi:hypothetical protein